jgi:WD40 repeat protein
MRWSDKDLCRLLTAFWCGILLLAGIVPARPPEPPATQETNKPLEPRALLRGDLSSVRAMAFAPDGKTLATGSDEGSLRLWELASNGSGRERARLPMPKDGGAVLTVSFSPDAKSLLTAGGKGDVILWDLATAKPRTSVKISSLAGARLSPDGRFVLVSRGELPDNEEDLDHVQLLDTATLRKQQIVDVDFEFVFDAIFSPDGTTVAVSAGESLTPTPASRGGQQRCAIELWTVKPDGTWTKGKRFGGDSPRPLRWPTFSGGGKLLAAASGDWLVWSVPQSALLTTLRASSYEARVCAFSPNVRWLATGALDSTVQLWNIKDWQSIYVNKGDTAAECNAIALSPDGKWLAVARKDAIALFAVPAK